MATDFNSQNASSCSFFCIAHGQVHIYFWLGFFSLWCLNQIATVLSCYIFSASLTPKLEWAFSAEAIISKDKEMHSCFPPTPQTYIRSSANIPIKECALIHYKKMPSTFWPAGRRGIYALWHIIRHCALALKCVPLHSTNCTDVGSSSSSAPTSDSKELCC